MTQATPNPHPITCNRFLAALGPGILFAGAAIGVSHLVQSTRAGAVYGLGLVGLVVLAHAMKLPAMLFGPRYAAATGRSLLHAYRRQGRWTLGLFGVVQVGTMFTIQAAITLVTAALVGPLVVTPIGRVIGVLDDGQSAHAAWVSAMVLGTCVGVLALGGFRWLDRVVKALMLVLAIGTVVAAGIALPSLDLGATPLLPTTYDLALLAFAVRLVGWMPAPLDITVWHSLWTLARKRQTGHDATRRECSLDFLVGYGLCIVLAIAFVVLGASVFYGSGEQPAETAGGFANQLIRMYAETLGPWAKPLVATCAIAVMYSTTITVLDAIPRTMAAFVRVARDGDCDRESGMGVGYWTFVGVLVAGALVIISRFPTSLLALVDLATTLSFLGTPLLVFFNHRAMVSREVAAEHRPGRGMRAWSWAGIAFWTGFALLFLGLTLFRTNG
ncbi:MAG: divalent metal cation transporter [Planctomycetota bacterium]